MRLLILERGGGERERERERNINMLSIDALTGNRTHNLLVHRMMLQPTEHPARAVGTL